MLSGRSRLSAKETCGSRRGKSAHLQFRDNETVLVNRFDDLSSVHVSIGLDESKLSFFASCKGLASGSVSIVDELELSSIDSYDGADEELIHADAGVGHSLQENSSVFHVEL